MKHVLYIVIFLFTITTVAQNEYKLTIEFEEIAFEKGKLFVALYNTEDSFLKKPIQGTIVEVNNGKATAVFNNIKSGIYAVSSFYDKNNNKKLDTNFMGIPKEPTAMSNNAKGNFGPPKFKDAKFTVQEAQTTIRINY